MPDVDIGRVKRNVGRMVDGGAPESEIDFYIKSEGASLDAVRSFKGEDVGTAPTRAPTASMLTSMENAVPAGEQRTTTDIAAYGKPLGPATIDEEGNAMLNQGGVALPVNSKDHVVLDDPATGKKMVYPRSEATNVNPALSISSILAPGLATGGIQVGKAAPAMSAWKAPQAAGVRSVEDLYKSSDAAYNAARAKGVVAAPEEIGALRQSIESGLAGKTREFAEPEAFSPLKNLSPDAGDIIAVRDMYKGGVPSAAKGLARESIDDFLSARMPELETARAEYGAASRAGRLGEATERAEGAAQGYDRAMRGEARKILNSQTGTRGYTDEQIKMLEGIRDGGKLISAAGQYTGRMNLPSMLAAYASGGATLPGFALAKLADKMTAAKVAKLDLSLRMRPDLAPRIELPMKEWAKIAELAKTEPNARNLSKLTLATRNMTNNLKDADIYLDPNELLKELFAGDKPEK